MPKNQPDPALQARIVDFVTENYLANQSPSTVKEIARALFVSESSIRRAMPSGNLPGLTVGTDYRDSKILPGHRGGSGVHQVSVYYPALTKLRTMLLDTRAALKHAQDFRKGVESVRS